MERRGSRLGSQACFIISPKVGCGLCYGALVGVAVLMRRYVGWMVVGVKDKCVRHMH